MTREGDGRISVKQDGVEGWFPKDEAAAPEEGVEYFAKLIAKIKRLDAFARRSRHRPKAISTRPSRLRRSHSNRGHFVVRWNNRANLYQSWDYDRAIQDYNRSIELSNTSAVVIGNRGNAWNNKRDFEKAIADYDESIRLNQTYINAIANRGNAYRELKEFDKALADYETALKIDTQFAFALSSRGALWTAKKEYDKALADINKAIGIDQRAQAFSIAGVVRRAAKNGSLALTISITQSRLRAEIDRRVRRARQPSASKQYDRAMKRLRQCPQDRTNRSAPCQAWLRQPAPTKLSRRQSRRTCLESLTVGKDKTADRVLAAAHAEASNLAEASPITPSGRWDYAADEAESKRRLKMFEMMKAKGGVTSRSNESLEWNWRDLDSGMRTAPVSTEETGEDWKWPTRWQARTGLKWSRRFRHDEPVMFFRVSRARRCGA